MLNLQCRITIGERVFNYVHELTISQNADDFTRTAYIALPQRLFDNSANNLFEIIKIGDPVRIELGYYPNLETRFVGYISRRVPNSPVQIYCEDESFIYKQRILQPVTLEDTEIGDFIEEIYDGVTEIYEPTRKIGTWRIAEAVNFLKVLENLRTTFGTSAFWDDLGVLHIDAQLAENSPLAGQFYYDDPKLANIIDIENLTWQEAAEFSQVVNGISEQEGANENGEALPLIEIFAFYDENGEIQTSNAYEGFGNINSLKIPYLDENSLKQLCITKLQKLNYTGYRGSFVTFGEPIVKVNDDVTIKNFRIKEMDGRYRVRGVNIEFGISTGYKQTIEISKITDYI